MWHVISTIQKSYRCPLMQKHVNKAKQWAKRGKTKWNQTNNFSAGAKTHTKPLDYCYLETIHTLGNM
jgi:hypothetical protein